jgi:hypothetical protein
MEPLKQLSILVRGGLRVCKAIPTFIISRFNQEIPMSIPISTQIDAPLQSLVSLRSDLGPSLQLSLFLS